MSFKPLSKYHLKRFCISHKWKEKQRIATKDENNRSALRFAFQKLFNKLLECEETEKDDKEEVEFKITGTSKKEHNDKESQSVTYKVL
jgi:hypothetical protein